MEASQKEVLKVLVGRTDVSQDDKVEMIQEFAIKYAKKLIREKFQNTPNDFEECKVEDLKNIHQNINEMIDWSFEI